MSPKGLGPPQGSATGPRRRGHCCPHRAAPLSTRQLAHGSPQRRRRQRDASLGVVLKLAATFLHIFKVLNSNFLSFLFFILQHMTWYLPLSEET